MPRGILTTSGPWPDSSAESVTSRVSPGRIVTTCDASIHPSWRRVKDEGGGGGRSRWMKCWDMMSQGPAWIANSAGCMRLPGGGLL